VTLRAELLHFSLEFYAASSVFQVLVVVADAADYLFISRVDLLVGHFFGFILNCSEFKLVIRNGIPIERVHFLNSHLFLFELLFVIFNRILGYRVSLRNECALSRS
jgi:hypothetical protein